MDRPPTPAEILDPAGMAASDQAEALGYEDKEPDSKATDKLGFAVAHSTAEAVRLVRRGARLVVHRHNVLNVGAAIAKRNRRAAKLAALHERK